MSNEELSILEVSRELGVTERTVHNYIDAGDLRAIERYRGKQRRRFVRKSDLAEFRSKLPGQIANDV